MSDELTYYLAFNNGLSVSRAKSGKMTDERFFFEGRTLEHLTGCLETPEVVFAAVAFDGGYRTEDGGRSWQKIIDGDVRTFTVDPHDEQIVYAGSGPICLRRSEDNGRTWVEINSLLELPDAVQEQWSVPAMFEGQVPPHVRHIFIHPNDQNLMYVALEHGGIVVSRDCGTTWEDASRGIDYLDMHMLFNMPGDKECYFVSSARGFYRTDNGGQDWHRVETGMPWGYTEFYSYSHEWVMCPGNPLRMILGGAKGSPGVWRNENIKPGGHILISDDAAETWRPAADLPNDMPWVPWTFAHHPIEENTIFAGMGDGARGFGMSPNKRGIGALYRSDDHGDSWNCEIPDLPSVLTTWIAAS